MPKYIPTQPGDRYGMLTVTSRGEDYYTPGGQRQPRWICECQCGKTVSVIAGNLRAGRAMSCGCSRSKALNMVGKSFGRLVVLARSEDYVSPSGDRHAMWLCACECGDQVSVRGQTLRSQITQSCGCLNREVLTKHGHSRGGGSRKGHPLYVVWEGMLCRCYTKSSGNYADYGGRGIRVCDRWRGRDGFVSFLADMGDRPPNPAGWTSKRPYWSIDRIDVNGDYEPSNCRWADPSTQSYNQRRRRL